MYVARNHIEVRFTYYNTFFAAMDISGAAINKDLAISLNGEMVLELADGHAKVMTYPEVYKYNSIDSLLGPDKAVIMLYLTRENYGHWIGIFKHPNGTVEFFDPYGIFPDDELRFADKQFKMKNDMDYPYLLKLLSEYNGPVEYNEKKYQRKARGVATCGRHVGLRLRMRHISLDQYNILLKKLSKELNIPDKDELITVLTNLIFQQGKNVEKRSKGLRGSRVLQHDSL